MDRSTAQRILQIWKTSGATSPDTLRKLFIRRSLNRSSQIGLQLAIDAAAGAGAFYAARSISLDELGNFSLTFKYGFYVLSMYLLIGAAFELFRCEGKGDAKKKQAEEGQSMHGQWLVPLCVHACCCKRHACRLWLHGLMPFLPDLAAASGRWAMRAC